ncbi:pyridoxal phosphate-dependent decarboxylase family protein [Maricaulis salignorans]|uniref:Aromatic-L-amino-acid decarboxylase n=1 Tax=Maricaulis salignorans TaxID=144026 RepID=A0A1G9NVW8_9PROT|nr:pyridoxal-dependent decarboxylase [Maricaulis salignorans]SDL90539.1 aromatic-L-amino-acid decarboxylase [Maricaulis salignorans]
MDLDTYGRWAKRITDWTVGYLTNLRDRPVRAQSQPGDILRQLPASPPEDAETMERIFADFEAIVPDGMTHWQHPRFFAYFPANVAPASMLAEQLTAAMGAQCMLWQTSPAATEMETRMVDWMRQALGLPGGFRGVIQDSASSATLAAILTMRERALGWSGNTDGLSGQPRLRIYASAQAHSSIDKAIRIAGIGQDNLLKIATDANDSMRPEALGAAIAADRAAGYLPAGVVLCVGGTSVGASDPIAAILAIAAAEGLYSHVDAAWAGSAMICPELREIWAGIEAADSIVFNPHKWLGAQFDCSIQFLADPGPQVRTLGLRPDYLETPGLDDGGAEGLVNYSEWTVPLGRRFRALKLWFLIRAYGLEGLRTRIRNHITWAREAEAAMAALPGFQIVTPCRFSLFTFCYKGEPETRDLLDRINADGRTYLTQTVHDGRFVIRFQVGQFDCSREDVMTAVAVMAELTR